MILDWLERRFGGRWLTLPPGATRRALYDALIAATAAHHGHTLLSADRRAAAVYAAFAVDVIYVAGG